jgi:hypothetical protein
MGDLTSNAMSGGIKGQSEKLDDSNWLIQGWGATVMDLHGRVFAATKARPRKAMTVAPTNPTASFWMVSYSAAATTLIGVGA